jgi:hypothetical protein
VNVATRLLGWTGIIGLSILGVLFVSSRHTPLAETQQASPAAAGSLVYAHGGLPELTEVGFRSAREMPLRGRIETGRDATGPIFVLVEPGGQTVRIAYASGGDPLLRSALTHCRDGRTYTLTGTVLDWGRGVKSFNLGKPLTITR